MKRYFSLDVFRGFSVAFMILVNNQMGPVYTPLDHASWHGLTPTDLVFPFFLFAVGNAMSFVMPRFKQAGTLAFITKVTKRALLIFTIGLLLNWSPFLRYEQGMLVLKKWTWINDEGNLAGVRFMSVLGRIALAYFFAALIVYFSNTRQLLWISIIILTGYWIMSATLGDPADPYSLNGYFGTAVDLYLFGEPHLYHGEGIAFDPEGITSTLPAIVSVLAGYLTGCLIQQKQDQYKMLTQLFVVNTLVLLAGYCFDLVFPVNKKIWSSSYVLVAAGFSGIFLALFIYTIECRHYRGTWTSLLNVFGKNPLFLFVLSGFIPRITNLIRIPNNINEQGLVNYITPFRWFYLYICKPLTFGHEKNASLLFAIIIMILYWLIGYILDRKKIYIKV